MLTQPNICFCICKLTVSYYIDYFAIRRVSVLINSCIQTCGVQLKWYFTSIKLDSFWSIDNVMFSKDSSMPLSRRGANDLSHYRHKRQSSTRCNLYYDNFDTGNYSRELWYTLSGGSITSRPCGASSSSYYWVYFIGSETRSIITRSLDLQGLDILRFNLIFNGCSGRQTSDDVLVEYKVSNSDTWVRLGSYNPTCCRSSTGIQIALPIAAQTNGVQLRWHQQSGMPNSDGWAIDEIRIGNVAINTPYQDYFSGYYNTQIWLFIVGHRISSYTYRLCGVYYLLNFYGNSGQPYIRQAVTQYLSLSQADSFSITFNLRVGSSCDGPENGEGVEISWRTDSGAWSLLETFSPTSYQNQQYVFLGLYNSHGIDKAQFRISQMVNTTPGYDVWYIDNFRINSYNASTCIAASPSPTSLPPAMPPTCKYYFDNFDDGTYKTDLWYTVSGIRITNSPCASSLSLHYVMEFYVPSAGELTTQFLDLREVEYISFLLRSYSRGCGTYYLSNRFLIVAYSTGNGIWHNLETFQGSCCRGSNSRYTIYLPKAAQANSVQLRWLHNSTSSSTSYFWMLDDIRIGESVHTILYQDTFASSLSTSLWSSVFGGSVRRPSCGTIDEGNALVFSGGGIREAITQFLDLRQANAVSFYIMTSSASSCDGLDSGETVEFSIRAGYGEWIKLHSINNVTVKYIYAEIPSSMKVSSAQLRWQQNVPTLSTYDVWSIDSVEVHSTYSKTACTTACISDKFSSGTYNTSIWSSINGALIMSPPCSIKASYNALHFNQSNNERYAITQPLDLRGMYAISFNLQIARFYNNRYCGSISSTDVRVCYSVVGKSAWNEIATFVSEHFLVETLVTIPLPLEARSQSVVIRIDQPSYSNSIWSLGDFGIYSPDQCPPLSVTQPDTTPPPTPTPIPPTKACNYYWDNFESTTYKNTLWSSFQDAEITTFSCESATLTTQNYGIYLTTQTGEFTTRELDLRGVNSINFFLYSSRIYYGCRQTGYSEYITISYKVGNSLTWNTLQRIDLSCCYNGRLIDIYIPPSVQIQSVYLRWSKVYSSRLYRWWFVDDIQIGKLVRTVIHSDNFTSGYNSSLWSVVLGGNATMPPCGKTFSGNALFFSLEGKREVITKHLDLRNARSLSFYLRIGSLNNVCEQADKGEDIVLSYRVNYSSWTTLQTFSATSYRQAAQVFINIDQALQFNGIQFRFKQSVLTNHLYDVWSIDNFVIDSREKDTDCSMACYYDNFNSGSYSRELWSTIVVASVVIPPCSENNYGNSLYFTASGTREAITNYLDLRGLYAITFTLQIGSFDNECDQAEPGDDVVLYYLISGGSHWVKLKTFNATGYTRATKVTISIPLEVRVQNVALRWAQIRHSGLLQDTWFIDNVGIYSPDQCPPRAYQLQSSTPPPVISSPNDTTCNYYLDDFDDGTYKTSLWHTVRGMRIVFNSSCYQHLYALELNSPSVRELTTQLIDLRGVEYIRFYMRSVRYSRSRCYSHYNSRNFTVSYSIAGNGVWNILELYNSSCCVSGGYITVYLPKHVQVNPVQLRWLDNSTTSTTSYDVWILDDIQIGENVYTVLYQENFTSSLSTSLWSSVFEGSVMIPPCGAIDEGNALFFSQGGIREAITQFIDLSQANAVSFYIMTSSASNCDGLDSGETVDFSIRAGYGDWVKIRSFESVASKYIYIEIPANLKVSSAKLRWKQSAQTLNGQDVWSIDSIKVHSRYSKTSCSMACIFDSFHSGNYNTSVWRFVSGAQVAAPPCSIKAFYKALHFNQSNTREAITQSLDLRGMYAISFNLQIIRSNEVCTAVNGENVIVYYSTTGANVWTEIGSFTGTKFVTETFVTIPLPLKARSQSISIRIAQPSYSDSIWSLGDFGIYSPDQCPPLSVTQPDATPPPTPTPTPSTGLTCNYYWDNFDSGTYKNTLWSSFQGGQVNSNFCQLPSAQRYAIQFLYATNRELTTHALDLRGVESITFYLKTGNNLHGCYRPSSNISLSYRYSSSSSWKPLETFVPSCCASGKKVLLYLPTLVQVSSVHLRWFQQYSSSSSQNRAEWALDDVQIGKYIQTTLYRDDFNNNYNAALWTSVLGGRVQYPSCGVTASGNALHFSLGGRREAITKHLDLRGAKSISFYIMIGSRDDRCEQADIGEDIVLSYRINYGNWKTLQTFLAVRFRDAVEVDIAVDQSLQVNGVQLRFSQKILALHSYDVWSIDNFLIESREKETKCSMACYSDNFNSESYNPEIWSSVTASVIIPPCSENNYGSSLYFTASGTREAITNYLDLRGLYAITFTLQIGSFDNECDQAETGDDVILYYSITSGLQWVMLKSFSATSYTRATTVTVPVPLELRVQSAALRWAQPQHSGSFLDTWFIDNVEIYSPDQCPPRAYVTATSNLSLPTPTITHNLVCNYYYDNFDDGSYKVSLWHRDSSIVVTSIRFNLSMTHHYAVEFSLAITERLDLRGVENVSFYLLSNQSSSNVYLEYRTNDNTVWDILEMFTYSCCLSGTTLVINLPIPIRTNAVQLRWRSSLNKLWVLDNVEIGNVIDTILYEDLFTREVNSALWSSISGSYVATPPCGVTDSGHALYFSRNGRREAVTVPLDLRQATSVSFYLRIGSDDSTCENAESAEDLEFSYRMRSGYWTTLQTFTSMSYRTPRYVDITIPNEIKANGVQLRITQTVHVTDSYDVWSIDTFTVHSMMQRPECSMACYMDNFQNNYNHSIWASVVGGIVVPLLCSSNYKYSEGLYFNGSNARVAVTRNLDLSGLYAISFNLQILLSNGDCSIVVPHGEDVTLSYSVSGGTWYEFKRFDSGTYNLLTDITAILPVSARQPNVAIQITQPSYAQSIWAIDDFGIYSPDGCPPLHYATPTTSMPIAPSPYPSPAASTVCNYYSDNFDSGYYDVSLWSTVTGIRISLEPCRLPYSQHYGGEFYSFGRREMITDPLDLRGVEYISFYLLSGSSSNGCSEPQSNEGIYVAYAVGTSSTFTTLEYFEPSCCSTGARIKVHLPSTAQTTSVKIRWYQSINAESEGVDVWVLDDIQIGTSIDIHFYEDYFASAINSALWDSVVGASVVTPPCGVTHSGNALYFSVNGTRHAITQELDLRHATGLSFYLRIGSSNGRCENNDITHGITLLWRANLSMWMQINSYRYIGETRLAYVTLTDSMKVTGVQFQIMQSTTPGPNIDVWSIDDFIVHSMHEDTLCTVACYSDDFNNGQYSPSLWAAIDGATVTSPACSNQYLGNALYFAGSGIRQAVTRPIDVRGFYAISFYLHIGSFSGNCEQAESGENVNLYYRFYGSASWVLLKSYDATAYTRETRITEKLSRNIQRIGVTFRWMQVSHSGTLDDTWSLDNVGFHSPDECPPIGYESVNLTSTTATTTMMSTSTVTVFPTSTTTAISASITTASTTTASTTTASTTTASTTAISASTTPISASTTASTTTPISVSTIIASTTTAISASTTPISASTTPISASTTPISASTTASTTTPISVSTIIASTTTVISASTTSISASTTPTSASTIPISASTTASTITPISASTTMASTTTPISASTTTPISASTTTESTTTSISASTMASTTTASTTTSISTSTTIASTTTASTTTPMSASTTIASSITESTTTSISASTTTPSTTTASTTTTISATTTTLSTTTESTTTTSASTTTSSTIPISASTTTPSTAPISATTTASTITASTTPILASTTTASITTPSTTTASTATASTTTPSTTPISASTTTASTTTASTTPISASTTTASTTTPSTTPISASTTTASTTTPSTTPISASTTTASTTTPSTTPISAFTTTASTATAISASTTTASTATAIPAFTTTASTATGLSASTTTISTATASTTTASTTTASTTTASTARMSASTATAILAFTTTTSTTAGISASTDTAILAFTTTTSTTAGISASTATVSATTGILASTTTTSTTAGISASTTTVISASTTLAISASTTTGTTTTPVSASAITASSATTASTTTRTAASTTTAATATGILTSVTTGISSILSYTTVEHTSVKSNTRTSLMLTSASVVSTSSVTNSISVHTSASVVMSTFSGIEPTPTSAPLLNGCVENFDLLNNGVYRLVYIYVPIQVYKILMHKRDIPT